jgi:hypothetical protein
MNCGAGIGSIPAPFFWFMSGEPNTSLFDFLSGRVPTVLLQGCRLQNRHQYFCDAAASKEGV